MNSFFLFSLRTIQSFVKINLCLYLFILFSDPISFSGSLIEALENLSKRLRLIKDIPLKVSSVQPIDPGTVA